MSAIRSISELEAAAKVSARNDALVALRARVSELRLTMQCNCNLDSWEPEIDTGHSWVCRIHKAAKGLKP